MTDCSRLEDYLADRLANADVLAFEAHASGCDACGAAVTRRRAVERAAQVLRRNQTARDGGNGNNTRRSSVPEPAAVPRWDAAATDATITRPRPARIAPSDITDTASSSRMRRLAIGVVIVAIVASAIAFVASQDDAPSEAPQDTSARAPDVASQQVAPTQVPTPSTPELAHETPAAAAPRPAPDAPTASSAPQPTRETPPTPLTPQPAAAPATGATPSPTADSSPTTTPDPGPAGFFPIGTDIETLAKVVASKRCGMAVTALKARVVRDASDARSWALLTQCYAKRKRWQSAVDAYDQVVAHGNAALVQSVRPEGERARAALEAETSATATPASPPEPQ